MLAACVQQYPGAVSLCQGVLSNSSRLLPGAVSLCQVQLEALWPAVHARRGAWVAPPHACAQRPHVTTRLSARLPRRSGRATIFRLLMSQLQVIRLLARSYAGAPPCPCVLRALFFLAWAFRFSLGPGRRRGSARFRLRGAAISRKAQNQENGHREANTPENGGTRKTITWFRKANQNSLGIRITVKP